MRASRGAWRAIGIGLPLACALLGAAAPGAPAVVTAEVTTTGGGLGSLRIIGGAEGDTVDIDYNNGSFRVFGSGEPVVPGNGCKEGEAGKTQAECAGARDSVYVNLGEGENTFTSFRAGRDFPGPLQVVFQGGSMKDRAEGGMSSLDTFYGGGGNDSLATGGSFRSQPTENEVLVGGPGDDHLEGGEGPDLIDGGPGVDTMLGDHVGATNNDGVDHIDAANAEDKYPASGNPAPDMTIDCGGMNDTYQLDKVDKSIPPVNCEKEQVVSVQLTGAANPAAGATPGKPKPEEKVTAEFEAGKKMGAQISGVIVVPKAAGKDQKPKLAPFSLGSAPLDATVARTKKAVIRIKPRTLTLRPGVERFLELDFSARTERALRQSLAAGGLPALKVTIEALGKKGGKGTRKDTDRIEFGL